MKNATVIPGSILRTLSANTLLIRTTSLPSGLSARSSLPGGMPGKPSPTVFHSFAFEFLYRESQVLHLLLARQSKLALTLHEVAKDDADFLQGGPVLLVLRLPEQGLDFERKLDALTQFSLVRRHNRAHDLVIRCSFCRFGSTTASRAPFLVVEVVVMQLEQRTWKQLQFHNATRTRRIGTRNYVYI